MAPWNPVYRGLKAHQILEEISTGFYKTFLIYRTCMRRAPARPVRACFARSCCSVALQEHDLRATPVQRNAKQTLSSHFTLRSSHPALHTSHLHFTLHTSSHLKSCELFSPHLTSPHLIPSLLTCHLDKFFSTVFISSEHWSTFFISSKFFSTHLSCSARQKALNCQREVSCTKKTLGAESFCAHKLEKQMHLHRKAFTKYFGLQSLHKALPSTTLYYKTDTEYFPVLLCAAQLAQSTSPLLVLHSLRKAPPPVLLCTTKLAQSSPQYDKACTKHVPVLLCTTKLAQSTSQYYFVLQSLHKARPSTTLYCKACTKHFPVLLCTTKLAQSTSQYHFALQSSQKKHVLVLPCTTKLAQSLAQYYFVHSCSHHNVFCSITWLTRISLSTWQQNLTTIMQPFQCDLQPEIQQAHRTTHAPCRTQRRNRLTSKRSKPQPLHTQEVPFIARCSHFTQKNARFRAPSSSPTQAPCNIHAAITMHFAAWRG